MLVNLHDAKTHLSRLVDRAAAGEDIVIARVGDPIVRLVPYVERSEPRVPGSMAGRATIAADFDDNADFDPPSTTGIPCSWPRHNPRGSPS